MHDTRAGEPRSSTVVRWGVGALALLGAIGGAWLASLPLPVARNDVPPTSKDELDSILAALKPPKRAGPGRRPLAAIVGINDSTETTDYLMPYGILKRSDVVDVMLVATGRGPVKLYPVLTVEPHSTVAQFDSQYPDGADYVIVPAMSRDDDPAVLAWLKSQALKGATVVGVCAGAKVVAAAGLLDGKRGTTHWYFLDELRKKHPSIRYVADRRFVADRGVVTTTGISASMPMTLTLIEAVAGRLKAESIANAVGLPNWDARHDSSAFKFTRPFALTAIANTAAFWNRERLGIELRPGMDEVSLALVADAWSRTYRSHALTYSGTADAKQTLNGVRVIPDRVAANWPAERRLPAIDGHQPAKALNEALQQIATRYGKPTEAFVATQLEYPLADTEE